MRGPKPKPGQRWSRLRTARPVTVVAVTNPRGESPAYVVIESDAGRASAVRLDRWHRDYEGPL